MQTDLIFIMPVYNDWESARQLMQEIEKIVHANSAEFIIVNDSSDVLPTELLTQHLKSTVTIIELSHNMGHQKAIAVGLAYANEHGNANHIVVMDSDGEDKPEDLPQLLDKAMQFNGVIFARRSKRSEGFFFRLFYQLYKLVFVLLTGKKISFGNYCVMPKQNLRKLVHVPEIWNHFSGGVIRSGLAYTSIPTERGKRFFGTSKMNFTRLILHGLSAVSVYADFMAIRLIIFSVILIVLTTVAMISVAFVRFFTQLAIPGWATFTVLGLGILLFLALLLGLFLLFNVLSMKTQKTIIPAKDYLDYIMETKIINVYE